MVSNGVPSVKGIWLLQNSTSGEVTSISDEAKRSGMVRQGQNWSSGEGMNEGLECRFLGSFPMEGDSFLGQFKQGSGNLGESLDESSIEVTESQESLDLFYCMWCGPTSDPSQLCRVHPDLAIGNDDAKILNRGLCKDTFFRFEVKVISFQPGQDFMRELVQLVQII
jgi:hypothetical protein